MYIRFVFEGVRYRVSDAWYHEGGWCVLPDGRSLRSDSWHVDPLSPRFIVPELCAGRSGLPDVLRVHTAEVE